MRLNWLGDWRRRLSLSALTLAHLARLLTLGRRQNAIVVEVLCIETCERLRLELLQSERRAVPKRLVDHSLHPAPASAIVAAT